ncbi:hypothetical protein RIF29_16277 [Crotalaria pallida]|uniref:RRM domain-containing protein n=1 Tax=Crotalaria pallida TaxID=3830 RepID=A0AAN9IBW2_CROPI
MSISPAIRFQLLLLLKHKCIGLGIYAMVRYLSSPSAPLLGAKSSRTLLATAYIILIKARISLTAIIVTDMLGLGRFVKKIDRVFPRPDAGYTNLYMKNLDLNITEAALHEKFSSFGKIVRLAIAKDNNGVSKGFGFVNYDNLDDAKRALEAINGTKFGSSKILYVAKAQKKDEREQILHNQFEEKRKEQILKYMDMDNTNELDNMDFEDDEMDIFDLLAIPSPSDSSLFSLYDDNVQEGTSSTRMENNQFRTTEFITYENSTVPPPVFNNPNPQPWSPNEALPNHLSSSTVQGATSSTRMENYQFQTTESITYENSAVPPSVLNNPNPQPWLPNSSAPLPNEALPNHLSSSMVQGATSSTRMDNNQFQTNESITYENPVVPPPILNNLNPQPWLPNSSAPLPNEALPNHLSSSTVGMISEEEEEEVAYQYQNENLQRLHDLSNQFFGETNNIQDSYTTLLQQQPVKARPWNYNEMGIPIIQLTTNQISGLSHLQNDQINTSASTWNTRFSDTLTPIHFPPSQFGETTYNSFASGLSAPSRYSDTLYPNHSPTSQIEATSYSSFTSSPSAPPRLSQVVNGIQIEQVAACLENRITLQSDRPTILEPSSSRHLNVPEVGGSARTSDHVFLEREEAFSRGCFLGMDSGMDDDVGSSR